MEFDDIPGGTLPSSLSPDPAAPAVALPEVPSQVRQLLDGSVDAAVVVDAQLRVLYHNAPYQSYSGLRARAIERMTGQGACCRDHFRLEICERDCVARRALATQHAVRLDEIHARRADGQELTLIVTATPLEGGLVIETYRDVTADARIQRKYKVLLENERRQKEDARADRRRAHRGGRAPRERGAKRTQAQLIHQEKMSSARPPRRRDRARAQQPHRLRLRQRRLPRAVHARPARPVRPVRPRRAAPDTRRLAEAQKRAIEYDFLRKDAEKLIRSIRAGAERTASIVRDLKTFSHAGAGAMQPADLVAGLETTLNLVQPLLKNRITVHRDFAALPPLLCNAGHLNQVFMNIFTNAAQAMVGEGHIWVTARHDGEAVRVTIRDSGPGIPAEVLQDFRAVLHDEGCGPRHRARPRHLARHHPRPRRRD